MCIYPAEEYHQDYYMKHPDRYKQYHISSGRDPYIQKMCRIRAAASVKKAAAAEYASPRDRELKTKLTPLQYSVTRENGTERPFENAYWDNKEPGIYVDVASGEPLFSSRNKRCGNRPLILPSPTRGEGTGRFNRERAVSGGVRRCYRPRFFPRFPHSAPERPGNDRPSPQPPCNPRAKAVGNGD